MRALQTAKQQGQRAYRFRQTSTVCVDCDILPRPTTVIPDWYRGSSKQLLGLAQAIRARKSVMFKRCAVRVVGNKVCFWRPRNSTRASCVPLERADRFADHVFYELGPNQPFICVDSQTI